MLNKTYRNSFNEVIDILNHTRKEDVQKISPNFIEYLKKNASKTYVSNLDHSKTIKEMNLSLKTKAILALIYKKYWSGAEEGHNESQKNVNLNESAAYNFNKESNINQILIETKTEDEKRINLIPYKESFFEKMFNKIKNIFSRVRGA